MMSAKAYAAFMIWETTRTRWHQSRASDAIVKAVNAYVRSARAGDMARQHAPGSQQSLHELETRP
jgi:hypothetical protein